MGKPTGFLESPRVAPRRRPAALRLRDWREVYETQSDDVTREQASRCMDCGIPFCHHACPLGNLIPEWNDQIFADSPRDALERLHATNNFPEFTGRLCPAPCESACVLGISDDPVTIERIEYEIIERGFRDGLVVPRPPREELGWSVAIVGSGPAGLAAAQQLRRVGYAVTVFEQHDEIGGLLRFGIPEFKMEKWVIDRRLAQLEAEGVAFKVNTPVGSVGGTSMNHLRATFDAVVLAVGSTRPRAIPVPGSDLDGIYPAMDYLTPANRAVTGAPVRESVSAHDRDVVILGGGDTGADCLGTALRQGARSVTQLEIMDRPPDDRGSEQPWPTMPLVFKVTSAHEEGGQRTYAAETVAFEGDDAGRVRTLVVHGRRDGDRSTVPATLVLLAAGFIGPDLEPLALTGLARTTRDTVLVDDNWMALPRADHGSPVFACGDAVRGQSLIVWALAEGRAAAAGVDRHFRGTASTLGAPVTPYSQPWE